MPQRDRHWISLITASQVVFGTEEQCQLQGEMPHPGRFWVYRRKAEILPTPYFHVVFTLPEPIAAIAYQNKAFVYGILFRATAETLSTIAADPEHLGAEIGFFAVLHSWG